MLDKEKKSVHIGLLITTIIYLVALVTLTHIPQGRELAKIADECHIDKMLHVAAYATFTALLMLSMGLSRSWVYYAAAFLLILIIAGMDEYTQVYVGRTNSVSHWLAKALGSFAAFINILRWTVKS